jgi:hypothetical protein
MPPLLFEESSSCVVSGFVSLTPSLEVPRGKADRLLSRIPQPIVGSSRR